MQRPWHAHMTDFLLHGHLLVDDLMGSFRPELHPGEGRLHLRNIRLVKVCVCGSLDIDIHMWPHVAIQQWLWLDLASLVLGRRTLCRGWTHAAVVGSHNDGSCMHKGMLKEL